MKSLVRTAVYPVVLLLIGACTLGCESDSGSAGVSIEVEQVRTVTDANLVLPENGVFLELTVRVTGEDALDGLLLVTAQEFFITDASKTATLAKRVFGAGECGDADDGIVSGASLTCSVFFDVDPDFEPVRLTYLNQAGGQEVSTAVGVDQLPVPVSGGGLFPEFPESFRTETCERGGAPLSSGNGLSCGDGELAFVYSALCGQSLLPIRYQYDGSFGSLNCVLVSSGGCGLVEVGACLEAVLEDPCVFSFDPDAEEPHLQYTFKSAEHPCAQCGTPATLFGCDLSQFGL